MYVTSDAIGNLFYEQRDRIDFNIQTFLKPISTRVFTISRISFRFTNLRVASELHPLNSSSPRTYVVLCSRNSRFFASATNRFLRWWRKFRRRRDRPWWISIISGLSGSVGVRSSLPHGSSAPVEFDSGVALSRCPYFSSTDRVKCAERNPEVGAGWKGRKEERGEK